MILKRAIAVFMFIISVFLCGCSQQNTASDAADTVTVNMPTDDSINGYRLEGQKNPENISSSAIKSSSAETVTEDAAKLKTYCASRSSAKFHLSTCGIVKNIKAENLFTTDNREELTEKGYEPCQKCNP